jgi:hypothetical protein
MTNGKDDAERFKRIRDQQLRARDPQKAQRKMHRGIATRHKKSREPFNFQKIFTDVPRKWTGMILGACLGLLVMVILPSFVTGRWTSFIGLGVLVILTFIGFAVGQAADVKKDLEDLIK